MQETLDCTQMVWAAILYLIGSSIMLDLFENAPFDDDQLYSDDD